LTPGAVRLGSLPAGAVPDGALTGVDRAAGRMLAAPLRRGEPITDVRLAGAQLARVAAADPDAVSVPLRLSDPDVAALLHPGATVDVVTLGERQDQPVVLGRGATVLAVLDAATSSEEGRLVLVALEPDAATRVAGASLSQAVTVTVR
ncbi:MAG: SAF domain-containing protein, partial [Pseudonocardiaceae bacterium]